MAPIVASLGHEVIARSVEVNDVGAVTARERPDVALLGLGESSDHALMLIERSSRSPPEGDAFDLLCDRSRAANRKLVDIAAAVVDGHALLPAQAPEPAD